MQQMERRQLATKLNDFTEKYSSLKSPLAETSTRETYRLKVIGLGTGNTFLEKLNSWFVQLQLTNSSPYASLNTDS